MIPAVGRALRSAARRAASASLRFISSSRPSLRQPWKVAPYRGNRRESVWQPVVAMVRIASDTWRRSVVRGLPVVLQGGIKAASTPHSASVRSRAYLSPARSCWRRVSSVKAIGISVQFRNRTESQPAELTQSVSNQALRHLQSILRSPHDLGKRNPIIRQPGRRRTTKGRGVWQRGGHRQF